MAFLARKKPVTEAKATATTPAKSAVVGGLLVALVSEKSARLQPLGQYTFAVGPTATKVEVKKMIERTYNVRVAGVNSVRLPRKFVRRGRSQGYTKVRRHFIVRLAKGQTLPTNA
jgi:large subunit ribosomal protein L23